MQQLEEQLVWLKCLKVRKQFKEQQKGHLFVSNIYVYLLCFVQKSAVLGTAKIPPQVDHQGEDPKLEGKSGFFFLSLKRFDIGV